jgi:Uma2 family endonuclease
VKKKVYAKYGVGEYWLVDPEAATLEVLVLSEDGYISAGIYSGPEHLLSPLLPELNLPLTEIFGR